MRKSIKYLVIISLALAANAKGQEKFTVSLLKEDLHLAKQALEEAHPGLYRYSSKDHMDSLFNNAGMQIRDGMTQQDFYRLLVPVISGIGCGHTKLHPDSNWENNYFYERKNLFPLHLYFKEGRAFVLGNYGNDSIIRGSEINSINGQPVSEIVVKLLPSSFSDGRNLTFRYIELSRFFSAYYANLIGSQDSFIIEYVYDGKVNSSKMRPVTFEQIEKYNRENDTKAREPYYYTINGKGTAVLTVTSFWESGDLKFPAFIKKAFADFREKNITSLIIDLRNNEGGKDDRGALLMSYLMDRPFRYYDRLEATTNKKFSFSESAHLPKSYGILRKLISKTDSGTYLWKHNSNLKEQKPAKDHYDGKVYVLINGASFSVTAEFASAMNYHNRAVFIGEETGGGYYGNNSGTFVIVTLPNSRLNIGIPMLAYYMAVRNYQYPDHGVIPDYNISPGIQDLIIGRDTIMEFALDLTNR